MDKETEINQLLKHLRDGKAGSHLEPVIRSIRDYLKNINQIARSSGGAIIFFHKKRTEGSTLMMQVFPFKNNLPVFNDETVLTSEQQVVLLEKINSEKAYTFFWHFEKFSVNYNTAKHLDAEVPEQNRLKYDEHKVEYHIIDPKTGKPVKIETDWTVFLENINAGLVEKNTYEQVLFESGCEAVSFIPIPVLSTPSILLVLNKDYVKDDLRELLKSLYFRSRDIVAKYLYSRLIDELTRKLEEIGRYMSERELVTYFVNEISDVLLPISYRIETKNGELVAENEYYKWPEPDEENKSEYLLPLNDGEYLVTFKLTTFAYIDLEDHQNSKWPLINKSDLYESNIRQSVFLLTRLFKLLYKNYTLLRDAGKLAVQEFKRKKGNIDIAGLKKKVLEIEQYLSEEDEIEEPTVINKLFIDENNVHLFIDGEEVVMPGECKSSNQIAGFKFFLHMLQQASGNADKYQASPDLLLQECPGAKRVAPDQNIDVKRKEAQSAIDTVLESVYHQFIEFVNSNMNEIVNIRKTGNRSANSDFNKFLYYVGAFYRYLTSSKFNMYKHLPHGFREHSGQRSAGLVQALKESIREISELLEIYRDKDATLLKQELDKVDINDYKVRIRKARSVLRQKKNGIDSKAVIRESFKAMIKLLRNNAQRATDKRKAALEKLLQNLENARFTAPGKIDASLHNGEFIYQQENIMPYIKWEF